MSLIQDALKRKTEEQPPQPATAGPAAPPQPLPPVKPAPEKSHPSRLPIIAAVVVGLILLGFGVGVYMNRPQPGVKQAEPAAVVHPAPAPPTAAPSSAALAKEEVVMKEDVPVENDSIGKMAPKVNWPPLTFSGCAANGNEILVIINGRLLSQGREINGVTVLQIGKDKVLLEYKGEKRLFWLE